MIGEAVFEALVTQNPVTYMVVADWIEENCLDHPEAGTYMDRLRSGKLRTRTAIDAVLKFGSAWERKLYSRIDRIALKSRSHPELVHRFQNVADLFSLEGRRLINVILAGMRAQEGQRKRPTLAAIRKRQVSEAWWYTEVFKILLSKHYPPIILKEKREDGRHDPDEQFSSP